MASNPSKRPFHLLPAAWQKQEHQLRHLRIRRGNRMQRLVAWSLDLLGIRGRIVCLYPLRIVGGHLPIRLVACSSGRIGYEYGAGGHWLSARFTKACVSPYVDSGSSLRPMMGVSTGAEGHSL